jgi:hypothetical protein
MFIRYTVSQGPSLPAIVSQSLQEPAFAAYSAPAVLSSRQPFTRRN